MPPSEKVYIPYTLSPMRHTPRQEIQKSAWLGEGGVCLLMLVRSLGSKPQSQWSNSGVPMLSDALAKSREHSPPMKYMRNNMWQKFRAPLHRCSPHIMSLGMRWQGRETHLSSGNLVAVGALPAHGVEVTPIGTAADQIPELPVLDRIRPVCSERRVTGKMSLGGVGLRS